MCEGGTGGGGGGMVGGGKLNATGRGCHSAGGNPEDAAPTEAEHTPRRSGGAGGATPRKPRWMLDVRWDYPMASREGARERCAFPASSRQPTKNVRAERVSALNLLKSRAGIADANPCVDRCVARSVARVCGRNACPKRQKGRWYAKRTSIDPHRPQSMSEIVDIGAAVFVAFGCQTGLD